MSESPQTAVPVDDEFLAEFKRQTEAQWQRANINPGIYGFQFQRGTRWNHGLTDTEIDAYQTVLGVQFPHDFKRMLHVINGIDRPTVNVYGSSGEPHRTSMGVYSYPRDLGIVQEMMQDIDKDRSEIAAALLDEGVELESTAALIPIFSHRYLVCDSDLDKSPVLSIMGTDAIVYGDSLRAYLKREFL